MRDANQSVSTVYNVDYIPQNVLVAPDGRILKIWVGFEPGRFESDIDALLRPFVTTG